MLSLRNSSVALAGLLALGLTSATNAQITATARPIGSFDIASVGPVVYSNFTGQFAAFAAATGSLGFDDYHSTAATPTVALDNLQFVGGVTTAGQILDFNFFDSAQVFVTGFSVQLPQGGNFFWTINGTPTTPLATVPSNGILQLSARTGSTGRWFLTPDAPTVGTTSSTFGAGVGLTPPRNQAFMLTSFVAPVPEPGSVALMLGMTTLGGMLTLRRRRK